MSGQDEGRPSPETVGAEPDTGRDLEAAIAAVRIEAWLSEAAAASADHGIPLEAFLLAATAVYVRARPESFEGLSATPVLAGLARRAGGSDNPS